MQWCDFAGGHSIGVYACQWCSDSGADGATTSLREPIIDRSFETRATSDVAILSIALSIGVRLITYC